MVHYKIYTSYNELPEQWNVLARGDIFLQLDYLQAMELASPNNIHWYYIGVFNHGCLIGIAVVQRVQLYLKDMFRKIEVSCFKSFFRDLVSRILKGNVLVVGNLTHTGQHALYFNPSAISQDRFFKAVFSALKELKDRIKKQHDKSIRAIVIKDFFKTDNIYKKAPVFQSFGMHQVFLQPNMILRVKPEWLSINDYVSSLNKKYRHRYKRAKKKRKGLILAELNLEDIKKYTPELHSLYMNVSNNAKFNTFILPQNHFYSLKLHLKEHFKVYAYFFKNQLVGFYSLILNKDNLETYFLGYNKHHQFSNQLYLNMLYDMLRFGIDNRFKTVVYARTAMEIKSSVGAKAIPMAVYLKHTNKVFNAILKQVFKLMAPFDNWKERHPFKQ